MQNNKKRINLVVLIIVILALTIGGTLWFINSKKTSTNNNIQKEENFLDFSSKRLVVITDKELTDNYNAKSVNKTNSGKYILKYETEEETIASDNDNQSKIEQEQFRAKMLKLFGIVIIGLIIVLMAYAITSYIGEVLQQKSSNSNTQQPATP